METCATIATNKMVHYTTFQNIYMRKLSFFEKLETAPKATFEVLNMKKSIRMGETPTKNTALKYILIAVLPITAAGIWWLQSNSKISENATAVNSDPVMTTGATGNINEPDMVTVQGGRFAMGGNENNNEKPIHNVTLSSFKIAKYETTQAQWQKVMGSNPSYPKDCVDCPVRIVSWDAVQTFIKKLNTLCGKNYPTHRSRMGVCCKRRYKEQEI